MITTTKLFFFIFFSVTVSPTTVSDDDLEWYEELWVIIVIVIIALLIVFIGIALCIRCPQSPYLRSGMPLQSRQQKASHLLTTEQYPVDPYNGSLVNNTVSNMK